MGSVSRTVRRHLIIAASAAAALGVLAQPASAAVSASVSSNAVTMTATCPGTPGAVFTVTEPGGRSFEVSSPNSNTSGYATAGSTRGTYRFSAKCADGSNAGSGTFVIPPSGGGPMGGDGGTSGNAPALITGTLMLGAAAAGGALLLWRRRANAV